jgi:phosphoribosylaminoimidazolecarboxamide formyltransferase/IMP cyclohydrolase
MFKNALVSVSDKTGLLELLTPFRQELRIVSTGGTAQYLRDNGFKVIDVSEQTGFPEVMDGRVKTLHPNVHMALLGRKDVAEHQATLVKAKIENFDLVVVNLYPFEAAVQKNSSFEELIEKIDIGGPSMLRSAAKNFATITVLCDPSDYGKVIEKKSTTLSDRQQLAAKVFAHCSVYDSLVSQKLQTEPTLNVLPFGGRLQQSLRYGENPQQKAQWWRAPGENQGLHTARIIQGKELSYNNILDLDAAANLVREFYEAGVVAVKHNNPCGAAIAKTLAEACQKALKADPVSVFGGIIALNREVDADCAGMMAGLFLECIVAPKFSDAALKVFAAKKNLRILEWAQLMQPRKSFDMKSIAGGFVTQEADSMTSDTQTWTYSEEKPSASLMQDFVFGEKVCAALKSNAIAIVAKGQTLGLGMGQVNRVDAVEQAIQRMKTHHADFSADAVLISDAFFPFADSVQLAAQAKIKWILQPGGSLKDAEVQKAARELGLQMILTGRRHFRH